MIPPNEWQMNMIGRCIASSSHPSYLALSNGPAEHMTYLTIRDKIRNQCLRVLQNPI